MDPDFSSDYAKQLLNTIFNSYMRALKQEMEVLESAWWQDHQKNNGQDYWDERQKQ